jgi:3-oxoacyl-[acyl-carrier protein] reductase
VAGSIEIDHRVALVTGAGQNVGRQTALYLAQHGAKAVIVNDLVAERAERVAEEVEALGAKGIPIAADLCDNDAVTSMIETARQAVGPIDILINNAGLVGAPGVSLFGRFVETKPADWEPWLKLNLYGVMYATHAVLSDMVDREWGRIITVISDAGRVGEPNLAAYGAAKAGAAGFMRCIAKEVARHGVTANCVSLGTITPDDPNAGGEAMQELLKRLVRSYPIGRLGTPHDPAFALAFLASEGASWITGQTLPVNGGYSPAL